MNLGGDPLSAKNSCSVVAKDCPPLNDGPRQLGIPAAPHPNFTRALALKDLIAEAFAAQGHQAEALALRNCQTTELLVVCTHCAHRFWAVNKCKLRVCPICAYVVSRERGRMLVTLSKQLQFPKLITLTIPTWKRDPREGIALIRAHFNELRKHQLFKRVDAGAYSIELIPKVDGWHIHIHILLSSKYIPYQHLFKAWQVITKTQAPHVDIRAAENDNARKYIAKYAAKASNFGDDPNAAVAWHFAVKGLRLFATFGEWYALTPATVKDDAAEKPFVPQCPNCGGTHTMVFARDGPFMFGPEIWSHIQRTLVPDGITMRTIDPNAAPLAEFLDVGEPDDTPDYLAAEAAR